MTNTTKPLAAYKVKQNGRTRYSFGKVWTRNVADGKVSDHAKLVAHGAKLKAGRKYDLSKLKFPTLLAKVQKALASAAA